MKGKEKVLESSHRKPTLHQHSFKTFKLKISTKEPENPEEKSLRDLSVRENKFGQKTFSLTGKLKRSKQRKMLKIKIRRYQLRKQWELIRNLREGYTERTLAIMNFQCV